MDKIILQQKTKLLAVRIYKMAGKLPNTQGAKVISYQILKSSTSVAANYRAACRAKSQADFIHKLKIVEEEADETLFWLEFIVEVELMKRKLMESLIQEANEMVAIFTSAIKTIKSQNDKS